MALYSLYAGLNGGFGGASYHATEEFATHDEAVIEAWRPAREGCESYEGSMINSEDQIRERYIEDYGTEPSEEELRDRYSDEVEGWLSYWVRLPIMTPTGIIRGEKATYEVL